MTTINNLSSTDILNSGDQIPIYSALNGDTRRVSVNNVVKYFQSNFASPDVATSVYSPSTGFNVAVPTPTANLWVLLQPASTLATGTITLPLNTTVPDGTEILVTSTQAITSLSISGNGASNVYGAPTTLSSNNFFRLRFYNLFNSWYRVG